MKRDLTVVSFLIYFSLLSCVTVGVWHWYFTNPPVESTECAAITGRFESAATGGGGKSPHLVFWLQNNPTRFIVSSDGYRERFNESAFLANMRPGTILTVAALRSELDHPFTPLLDTTPIVHVYGLRDERMTYCTIAGRRNWEIKNRQLGLDTAILLSVMTIISPICAIIYTQSLRQQRACQAIQAHSVEIEAQDDGGYSVVE